MFQYNIQINNGVEAFGTEGKTITVNEVVQTVDEKAMAREIHHENMLIPTQVAESVLQNFAKAAVNLMSQGFAIQFKSGEDVVMRIYPDMHVKGGNINLARAKQLDPKVTEITVENAGDLVAKAGVTVRAKAECEQKFTDMLLAESSGMQRKDIIEKARVMMNSNDEPGGETPGGTEPQTVAAPTISGTTPFATTTQVTITGPDGAEIRYTTDGSMPTASSTLYSAAFSLSATTTVKAIAIKDGISSEVKTKTFTQSTGGESD